MCSSLREKRVRSISLRYHGGNAGPTVWLLNFLKNLNQLACDEQQKHRVTGRRVLQNERNV